MKTSLVSHGMKDEDTKTHKLGVVGHGLKHEGIKTKTFHTVALCAPMYEGLGITAI